MESSHNWMYVIVAIVFAVIVSGDILLSLCLAGITGGCGCNVSQFDERCGPTVITAAVIWTVVNLYAIMEATFNPRDRYRITLVFVSIYAANVDLRPPRPIGRYRYFALGSQLGREGVNRSRRGGDKIEIFCFSP